MRTATDPRERESEEVKEKSGCIGLLFTSQKQRLTPMAGGKPLKKKSFSRKTSVIAAEPSIPLYNYSAILYHESQLMMEDAIMIFWGIVSLLYALVTVFAVYMTHQEQKRQARRSVFFNIIGYIACTIWPIVGVAAFIAALRQPAVFAQAELD